LRPGAVSFLVAAKTATLDFPDRSNQSREAPNVQFLNIPSMFNF
jgi:hypothetical protein